MLLQVNTAKARGDSKIRIDVDLDGKIDKVKVDDAIDAIQGQIDNVGRAVDIAVNLKTEGADLDAERKNTGGTTSTGKTERRQSGNRYFA